MAHCPCQSSSNSCNTLVRKWGWRDLKIGMIGGTGPEGRGLAMQLALAGHDVVIGSAAAPALSAPEKCGAISSLPQVSASSRAVSTASIRLPESQLAGRYAENCWRTDIGIAFPSID